uniref:Uncharacterized protein n=1 Tax=Thermorudis peleae TaxID=1382356 RepID=A0A831WY00_9BACT
MTAIRRYDQRIIGRVTNGTLRLRRTREKHWLRAVGATGSWAVDERALLDARDAGATIVEVVEPDGTVWRTTITRLLGAEAVRLDLGCGVQRALPAECWERTPPSQLPLW